MLFTNSRTSFSCLYFHIRIRALIFFKVIQKIHKTQYISIFRVNKSTLQGQKAESEIKFGEICASDSSYV